MDFHAMDMKKLQSLCQNHGFKSTDWTKEKMIQSLSTIYKGNNQEIIDLDPDSANGVPKEDSDTVVGKDTDEKINVTSEVNSNDLVFYDLSESGTPGNAHVYQVRLASEVDISEVDILSDLHDFLGIKKVEEKEVDMIEMWRNMPLFSPTHISVGYDYDQYMDGGYDYRYMDGGYDYRYMDGGLDQYMAAEDSQKVDQFIENGNIIETTNYQYMNGEDSQKVDQIIENDNIIETSSPNHLVLPRVRNSMEGKNSQLAPRKKTMKQQARAKGKMGGSNASLMHDSIKIDSKGVVILDP